MGKLILRDFAIRGGSGNDSGVLMVGRLRHEKLACKFRVLYGRFRVIREGWAATTHSAGVRTPTRPLALSQELRSASDARAPRSYDRSVATLFRARFAGFAAASPANTAEKLMALVTDFLHVIPG